MLQKRIIPCLLLREGSLVKTIKFKKNNYIGSPVNTIRIFNELEVDELILLDILASRSNQSPDFKLIEEVAGECFMPLTYGGGIKTEAEVKKILSIGVEKVSINTSAVKNPSLIKNLVKTFGSQCIVGSIDIKKNFFGKNHIVINAGRENIKIDPIDWALKLERLGVGELLVTSINNDGTWKGYELDLIRKISKKVSIPVIANGGAGSLKHIKDIFKDTNCSAAAVSSLVLYQNKGMGVLINFPSKLNDDE